MYAITIEAYWFPPRPPLISPSRAWPGFVSHLACCEWVVPVFSGCGPGTRSAQEQLHVFAVPNFQIQGVGLRSQSLAFKLLLGGGCICGRPDPHNRLTYGDNTGMIGSRGSRRLRGFSEAMILPFQIKDREISGGLKITFGNHGNSPFCSAHHFHEPLAPVRPGLWWCITYRP